MTKKSLYKFKTYVLNFKYLNLKNQDIILKLIVLFIFLNLIFI